MSDHVMSLSKIKTKGGVRCYESAWMGRWSRSDTDTKRLKEINLPKDLHLQKESTGLAKLKGKMVSRVLDLFPNPDSAVKSVEVIPDMNTEPPVVADKVDSMERDEDETSRSTTQSKNLELFSNNYTNTKLLSECKRIWSDSETNSRSQVKRLKTCASDYSINETKSMKVVEGPSGQKMNYFFHRIFGNNNPGSRKYQKASTSQIKNLNMKGGGEVVNPWIQRWCKKKAVEPHEPGGKQGVDSKGTALEKQFPSIAAMALMGKALHGLHPSGLKKTNSHFIWNKI